MTSHLFQKLQSLQFSKMAQSFSRENIHGGIVIESVTNFRSFKIGVSILFYYQGQILKLFLRDYIFKKC